MNIFFLYVFACIVSVVPHDIHADIVTPKTDENAINSAQPEHTSPKPGKQLALGARNIDLYMQGQIQEGFFYGSKIRTLNDNVPDVQARFRHRMSVGFLAQFGVERYGSSAVDAAIKLHNMLWWQDEYSNLLVKQYPVTSNNPVFSFTDAWVNVHLETFAHELKKHPHSFKAGYFAYQLGRGVSLGFADEGGIKYLGFELSYDPIESAYYTPGLLWQGKITENIGYELYWSLMHNLYELPFLNQDINQSLLFTTRLDKENINKYGKGLGRWVLSGKGTWDSKNETSTLHAEPYLLWLHSTYGFNDLQIPQADRAINLGTYGAMIDFTFKRFNVNVEVAGQFGNINFFPTDNNDQLIQLDSSGRAAIAYDNVGVLPLASNFISAMPVTDEFKKIIDQGGEQFDGSEQRAIQNLDGYTVFDMQQDEFISDNETITRFNDLLDEGTPEAIQIAQDLISTRWVQGVANPFGPQHRPQQKLQLRGFMLMADISYLCKSIPFKWNLAGGYISGDRAPLINDETLLADPSARSYKGFLTLRDNRYRGQAVKSFSYMTMRTIERPAERGVHLNDISNLAYVGIGFDCLPLKPRNKLEIFGNAVLFIQPAFQHTLDAEGNATDIRSSRFAGTEINGSLNYRFLPNCAFLLRGAVFLPQSLYVDMKNQKTSYMTTTGVRESIVRGHDVAYAVHARISYDF